MPPFKSRVIRKKKSPVATRAYVQSQLRSHGEAKHIDTDIILASTIFTNTPVNLCIIPEGATESERIGDEVRFKSVTFRLQAQAHLTTPLDAHVRMIIFKWNTTGSPGSNSVLLLDGSTSAPVGQRNITSNKGKYTILYDRSFNIVDQSSNDHVMFGKTIRLTNKGLWNGAAGTATLKGQIWLQIKSDLTANGPDVYIACRVIYAE